MPYNKLVKFRIIIITLLFSSSLSAQLNESALMVRQLQPEVFNSIRLLSLVIHEGENYKVSQEINLQSEAYIEFLNHSEYLDLEVMLSLMRRFCVYQDQFDSYLSSKQIEECFSLPINWYMVNEAILNY